MSNWIIAGIMTYIMTLYVLIDNGYVLFFNGIF